MNGTQLDDVWLPLVKRKRIEFIVTINSDDEIKLSIEAFSCGCYMLSTQQPHVSSGSSVGQHGYRQLSSSQNVLWDSTIIMS